MKGARNKISLALITGVLPLFLILVVITPLWMYFTGSSFFISSMLRFAEIQGDNLPTTTVSSLNQLLLLVILYFPTGLFAFAIWQGMKVTQLVQCT